MIFRRRIDALATRIVSRFVAARWRKVSGRDGAAHPGNPYQHPHIYFAGLTARPWWDPAEFPWVEGLEQHAEALRNELHGLLKQGYLQPPPIEDIPLRERDLDQMLVKTGSWHLYRL